jgi:hypothetical protein
MVVGIGVVEWRGGEWRGRGGGEMKNTIVREAITIRTC